MPRNTCSICGVRDWSARSAKASAWSIAWLTRWRRKWCRCLVPCGTSRNMPLHRWSASSPPISAPAINWSGATKELIAGLCDGSVVLLDVRPEDEYGLGGVPGAMNIPLRQLEQRLTELPRKQEIVAYCRGPYCVLSFEAVAALRAHGFNVRRFEDGFPSGRPPACRLRRRPKGRYPDRQIITDRGREDNK